VKLRRRESIKRKFEAVAVTAVGFFRMQILSFFYL
jgi:hypothetical protein